jgi:ubiquitin-activating enzyme E1
MFQQLFSDQIQQLLYNYPANFETAAGELFWSGAKRAPTAITFDVNDPLHLEFIIKAASMRAAIYGLTVDRTSKSHSDEYFITTLASITVDDFKPKDGVKIAANDAELEAQKKEEEESTLSSSASSSSSSSASLSSSLSWEFDAQAEAIISTLPSTQELAGIVLHVADFDKDNDLHVSLVSATSNLRARNYAISEVDKHTSKLIAGKIIPAIATTTAMVAGLICLELYKLVAASMGYSRPIESFRSCFANLAIPIFAFGEPIRVKTNTLSLPEDARWAAPEHTLLLLPDGSRSWRWSIWDCIRVKGPLTVKEFNEFVKNNFGLEVLSFSSGSTILWAPYLKPKQKRERLDVELSRLVKSLRETTNTTAPSTIAPSPTSISSSSTSSSTSSTTTTTSSAINVDEIIDLDLLALDSRGEDVELPTFRYTATAFAKLI